MPYFVNVHDKDGGYIDAYDEEEFDTPREAQDFLDSLDGSDAGWHRTVWIGGIVVDEYGNEIDVPPKEKAATKKQEEGWAYRINVCTDSGESASGYEEKRFASIPEARKYLDNLGGNLGGYVFDEKTGAIIDENRSVKTKKKEKLLYRIYVLDRRGYHLESYGAHQFASTQKANEFLARLPDALTGYVTNRYGVVVNKDMFNEKVVSAKATKIRNEATPCLIEVGEGEKVYGYLKFESIPKARRYLDSLDGKHDRGEFSIGKNILNERGQIIEERK